MKTTCFTLAALTSILVQSKPDQLTQDAKLEYDLLEALAVKILDMETPSNLSEAREDVRDAFEDVIDEMTDIDSGDVEDLLETIIDQAIDDANFEFSGSASLAVGSVVFVAQGIQFLW